MRVRRHEHSANVELGCLLIERLSFTVARRSCASLEALSSFENSMPSGLIYALADFADRLLPKSRASAPAHARAVLAGLKRLAEVEERNPFVTLSATITAGVWVFYRGQRWLLINPGQKFLRVEAAYYANSDIHDAIATYFEPAVRAGTIEKTAREDYHQWRISGEALELVWQFVERLEGPSADEVVLPKGSEHPRYFPGEVREFALAAFEADGRKCPGVEGKSRPHKLTKDDRVEFDHILPHARGGSSSVSNIQVLCTACNRIKSATAW